MKKILVLLVSVFAMFAYDAVASNNENTTSPQTENSPQVCQFSLSYYSGTLDSTYATTSQFSVRLNCAQTEDVCATVFVYVEGECVASKVVCIEAGEKSSGLIKIDCPDEFVGKKYSLKVE